MAMPKMWGYYNRPQTRTNHLVSSKLSSRQERKIMEQDSYTPEPLDYKSYWEIHQQRTKSGEIWVRSRMKSLGYKSMADFRRKNSGLRVTAGTVSNWLRWGTIPLWAVPELCYALKTTPTEFLTALGYYNPNKMTTGGENNG